MSTWSSEQIIALAPDAGSARAGRELASPRKWQSLGQHDQVAWGECQGSAKDPYLTQIDLTEPAFKCTCPSRKFPCKHALGLFLLLAAQPGVFSQKDPPAWVSEWLAKRTQAAQKPAKSKPKGESDEEKPPAASASAPTAEKRAAKREERVRHGVEDLDLWLCDLMRQGLSGAQVQAPAFWETAAARLVDAQAPGLARKVREMADLPGSGEGWQGRLLAQIARLFVLIQGFQRLEQLSPPMQAEIRSQMGWTQDQEELLKQDGVSDQWYVLGRWVEQETLGALGRASFIKTQRTWLWGQSSRRAALVLSFAAPGQLLDAGLIPGTRLEAELVYFAGGFPLRALLKKQHSSPSAQAGWQGFASLIEANLAYATALTANPWLELFPMPLNAVTPCQIGNRWGVRDAQGRFVPFAASFNEQWVLAALSGGQPLDVFGEWNGETLRPLSVSACERFVLLQPAKEGG